MYFTYNGVSSETMGLKVLEFSPPPKAEQSADEIIIPGRETPITYFLANYSKTESTLKFAVFDRYKYRDIMKWLSGKGEIIFSDEDNVFYNAYFNGLIQTTRISNEIIESEITVTFDPFAYTVDNDFIDISNATSAQQIITNNGTIYSEPIIEIIPTQNETSLLKGDVNFDGIIDAVDVSLVMNEYATVLSGGESTFTEAQKKAADMNDDGIIDMTDASLILQQYTDGQTSNSTPSEQITIYINGETLIIGVPSQVIENGFKITVDSTLQLIYYNNLDGEKINIMQYSYGDLPRLCIGENSIFCNGNVDSMNIAINERWI